MSTMTDRLTSRTARMKRAAGRRKAAIALTKAAPKHRKAHRTPDAHSDVRLARAAQKRVVRAQRNLREHHCRELGARWRTGGVVYRFEEWTVRSYGSGWGWWRKLRR